jgi:hypothetical protein
MLSLNIPKQWFWLAGLVVAVLSFGLLLYGVAGVLGQSVDRSNLAAYLVFSLLAGGIAALLVFLGRRFLLLAYLSGWILGFFEMFRTFLHEMAGWGDLIGIVSLFFWTIIGLAIGIVLEVGSMVYRRIRKGS